MKFGLKGYKGKMVHASLSAQPIEVSGHWHVKAPMVVDDDQGVPRWIYELLKQNPEIEFIAVGKKESGYVYSRIDSESL